jgi:energy-coupling factor transporter ATP-binding protein EcfA2
VLAGLQRPTDGDVTATERLSPSGDAEPWRWRSRELAERISWTPQLPEIGMVASRVRDEVASSGDAVGRDPAWLQRRVDGLLGLLGLEDVADANPHQLSGGEQRRLIVAAALAHGAAVATFDEPTVAQDRSTWSAVVGALGAARDSGVAVGIATHDEEGIQALADVTLPLTASRGATS